MFASVYYFMKGLFPLSTPFSFLFFVPHFPPALPSYPLFVSFM